MTKKKKHNIYIIRINHIYLNNLHNIYKVQKPYFHAINKKQIQNLVVNIDNEMFHHNKAAQINLTNNLTLPDESYTLTSIDNYSFIKILNFFVRIKNIQNFALNEHEEDLQVFFSMFDIEKNTLIILKNYLIQDLEYKELISNLFIKLTDITFIDSEEFNNLIKNIKDNYLKTILIKIFQKMVSLKFILMHSIQDAMMLVPFRYFIQEYFYDGRGRAYLKTITTNIQLYPILRSFIKPFVTLPLKKEGFDHLKNNLSKIFTNDKLKKKFKN